MTQHVELACRAADRGLFDRAAAIIAGVAPQRLEYAACQSLLASLYRQTGQHAAAQRIDERGLAAPVADELGRSMCALGRVADRIGAADRQGAVGALLRADAELADVPADHWAGRWFDPWLLRAWVAAELALLSGEPEAAVGLLQPIAEERALGVPNTRRGHERAKTLLFLGVSQRLAGHPSEALRLLREAARIAQGEGLLPLLQPIAGQLVELDPGGGWQAVAADASGRLAEHPPPATAP